MQSFLLPHQDVFLFSSYNSWKSIVVKQVCNTTANIIMNKILLFLMYILYVWKFKLKSKRFSLLKLTIQCLALCVWSPGNWSPELSAHPPPVHELALGREQPFIDTPSWITEGNIIYSIIFRRRRMSSFLSSRKRGPREEARYRREVSAAAGYLGCSLMWESWFV